GGFDYRAVVAVAPGRGRVPCGGGVPAFPGAARVGIVVGVVSRRRPDVSSFWEDRFREYRYGTTHPVRPADWLYPLAHHWSDFFAGTCRGQQVLLGPYDPSLVACFFSPSGILLRVEERP